MNETHARTTANVIMAVAAVGAAVLVLRSPSLRRLAWRLARNYATGPLAVLAATTVRTAWDQSDNAPSGPAAPRRALGGEL